VLIDDREARVKKNPLSTICINLVVSFISKRALCIPAKCNTRRSSVFFCLLLSLTFSSSKLINKINLIVLALPSVHRFILDELYYHIRVLQRKTLGNSSSIVQFSKILKMSKKIAKNSKFALEFEIQAFEVLQSFKAF